LKPVAVGTVAFRVISDPSASLKRIAWAYGCAKKGSDEERMLLDILVARVKETL
jgi:hypothetical protein